MIIPPLLEKDKDFLKLIEITKKVKNFQEVLSPTLRKIPTPPVIDHIPKLPLNRSSIVTLIDLKIGSGKKLLNEESV